ncbi:MAG: hypothetical protein WCV67_04745 [Victivallaceae bacterium]|jgi:hypothetical protein
MKKLLLLSAISLIAASASFGVNPVKKVVFHCPDQSNWVSNDSKKVFAEGTLGQTFTPDQTQLSFFRVAAVKDPAKFKMVTPDESAALELRLWKCGQDYQKTRANLPLALVKENQGLWLNGSLYFKVDAAVVPHAPYYAELTAFATPLPCYNILWNYRDDHYTGGDLVSNGLRWGDSDLNFSSCHPADTRDGKLTAPPELVEIQFDQDMDTDKTSLTLEVSGQKGRPVTKVWQGKTLLYIAAGRIAGNGSPLSGMIKLNSVTATGAEESNEIPFTVCASADKTDAGRKITEPKADAVSGPESSHAEKIVKGIIRASCDNVQYAKGRQAAFSVNAWVEPVIGMQVSFGQITPETAKALKARNINTVSVTLPAQSDPETIAKVKDKVDLLHKSGFIVFWLINLGALEYDKTILGDNKDIYEVNWQGKASKKYCFNNPVVRKAFISSLNSLMEAYDKNHILLDGIIINEPGRIVGNFCYCNSCKQKFTKEYNCTMPEPLSAAAQEKSIPVVWPQGIPKAMYMNSRDEDRWRKMSAFYCPPVTEMIRDVFKAFRHYFPDTCCQVTTLTDIAPYYGLDFWNGIMNLEELNGIQTAIYWAVGCHSPTTVGAPGIANSFVGKAKAKNITCYYWLQGYDAGDNSGPLKPGDIKIAVAEAFKCNVDGILIWSYLNPILGPWDQPFHWPAYLNELKEAVGPYLKKEETSNKKIELKPGEKKSITLKSNSGGISYNVESSLSGDGRLSLTVKSSGYCTLTKEINLNTGKGE